MQRRYKCYECGSTKVGWPTFYLPNEKKVQDPNDPGDSDAWCENCQGETDLVIEDVSDFVETQPFVRNRPSAVSIPIDVAVQSMRDVRAALARIKAATSAMDKLMEELTRSESELESVDQALTDAVGEAGGSR